MFWSKYACQTVITEVIMKLPGKLSGQPAKNAIGKWTSFARHPAARGFLNFAIKQLVELHQAYLVAASPNFKTSAWSPYGFQVSIFGQL